jgi:hypothetical protein
MRCLEDGEPTTLHSFLRQESVVLPVYWCFITTEQHTSTLKLYTILIQSTLDIRHFVLHNARKTAVSLASVRMRKCKAR